MKEKIFTFWQGKMPDYIKLCIQTWKNPYQILTYKNLNNYTDLIIDKIKQYTLPQIADCVRVHVLRDQGGFWLDADTIMITNYLSKKIIKGNQETRENTIGYLYAKQPNMEMFKKWAEYQDYIINSHPASTNWNTFGNIFTDQYLKEHLEIEIDNITKYWPETYMISQPIERYWKYKNFYFKSNYFLSNIKSTDMLMLHNSWTPIWYKNFNYKQIKENNCTLSNILNELIQI